MAAIIKDDVGRPKFFDNSTKKSRIFLLANSDLNLIFGEAQAIVVDVNADDARVGTKISFPHLQRSAFANSDLREGDRPVDVMTEMPFVDRKIMLPLMDHASVVNEKICP